MSFSSDIKQELNKSTNLANKKLVKQELNGYLISGNVSIINNKTFIIKDNLKIVVFLIVKIRPFIDILLFILYDFILFKITYFIKF